MKINLLAIGRRMPAWVEAGCAEYVKRLPKAWQFTVRELAQARGNTAGEIMQREADQLLQSIPERAWVVALDQRGEAWSTEVLSRNVESWQAQGRDVVLLVGGADGLHASVRERADQLWILLPLVFPHSLVRVIVIEQLYRAQSILQGHPYHRN